MSDAKPAMTDHERGCEGRNYTCTCGYDADRDAALDALRAENERLRVEAQCDKEYMDNMRAEIERLRNELGDPDGVIAHADAITTAAETEAATLRAMLADAVEALDALVGRGGTLSTTQRGEQCTATLMFSNPADMHGFVDARRAARAVSAKIKEMTGE